MEEHKHLFYDDGTEFFQQQKNAYLTEIEKNLLDLNYLLEIGPASTHLALVEIKLYSIAVLLRRLEELKLFGIPKILKKDMDSIIHMHLCAVAQNNDAILIKSDYDIKSGKDFLVVNKDYLFKLKQLLHANIN